MERKFLNLQEFKTGMLESGRDLFRKEVLNKYHPDLRGFRALTLTQKIQNKFIQDGGVYKQKLRGIGIASFFANAFKHALDQKEFADAEVLIKATNSITELSLDTVLNDPDWDFKVKNVTILNQIIEAISSKKEFHRFLPNPNKLDEEYGWEAEILPTTTAGLNRLEFTVGTRRANGPKKERNPSEWMAKDYSASITLDVENPNQLDIRGKDGISTDRVRARHIQDDQFEIDPSTLPRKNKQGNYVIDFPGSNVLNRKDIYVELVARALMQSAWFGFDVAVPQEIPIVTDKDMQKIFAIEPHGPLRRRIVLGKIIDAFMVNPQKTFALMKRLGVTRMSPVLGALTHDELNDIKRYLPKGKKHRQQVLQNNNYSVFDIFSALINSHFNNVPLTHPALNYLYFYTDLFPDKRENSETSLITYLSFTEPFSKLMQLPSVYLPQLMEESST